MTENIFGGLLNVNGEDELRGNDNAHVNFIFEIGGGGA